MKELLKFRLYQAESAFRVWRGGAPYDVVGNFYIRPIGMNGPERAGRGHVAP